MAQIGALEVPRVIKLKSSDGYEFSVPRNVIAQSVTINTILEGMAPMSPEPIRVSKVDGRTLTKVLEWCHQAPGLQEQINENPRSTELSEWETEFVKVANSELYEIVLAAHHLEINGLMDLCCKTMANMIKGKSAQQIRDTFGFKDDSTKPEEQQGMEPKGTSTKS